MAFNGAGLFTRIYQWVNDAALGLNVDATRTDTDSNDIASGLSNCVTRDGQSPWLANLPAAGFKLTGLGTGMNAADSVTFDQVFNSPSFVTPYATTSPILGDNSLRLATTAYVVQQAFSVALPAQPGDTVPRALFTVSGVASWEAIGIARVPRTANTVIDGTNISNLIDFTANTFTQTFAAVASLPANFYCYLQNSGTGDITLDPNGAETIDGLASYVMYPGEVRLFYKNETGLLLKTIKLRNFYRSTISNFTYIHPPGYDEIESDQVAGGGGGGSGCRGVAGSVRNGGAPGGTPVRKITRHRNLIPGNSYPVVIGANGVGGAAVTINATAGNIGTAAGNSTFNGFTAFGGVAGLGALLGANTYAHTSGSGSLSVGLSFNTATATFPSDAAFGGLPAINRQITSAAASILDAIGESGATAFSGTAGGNSVYGGAASTSSVLTGTTLLTTGGNSQYGVAAAGQGGWITAADTMPATAGYAGLRGTWSGTGTPGGTCGGAPTAGANGTAATNDNECGTSGSGGGSSITVAAAAGGNGGFPGGAGGGGGASLNGNNSGKGGDGAAGRTILKGI